MARRRQRGPGIADDLNSVFVIACGVLLANFITGVGVAILILLGLITL